MTTAAQLPQLVYIAGYGRSGSTLLDTLLGSHDEIIGTGELTWLFRQLSSKALCTCGAPMVECSFWGQVETRLMQKNPTLNVDHASALTLRSERLFRRNDGIDDYWRLWSDTLECLRQSSGARIIVDSSKSSRLAHWRMSLLARGLSCKVKVLHLVRDPRSVMNSARRGRNHELEQHKSPSRPGNAVRAVTGWIFANTAIELQKLRMETPLLRVRYEDLVHEPTRTLNTIGEFLKVDLGAIAERIEKDEPLERGHGIAGNRMRRGDRIVLQRQEPNSVWGGRWNALTFLARPLMQLYRYV